MDLMEQRKVFSKNLRYYIAKSGKMQKDIAKSIGVSTQTFSTWTVERAIPRMNKIESLANYFGITKTDLIEPHDLGLENEQEINMWVSQIKQDEQLRRLLTYYTKLNELQKSSVQTIVESMTSNQ